MTTSNEYGQPVSKHVCSACGEKFTVCPPADKGQWGTECLADHCRSYDSMRDPLLVGWMRDEVQP